MYLAEWLETDNGRFPMVGAIGGGTSMAAPRLTIGYRTAAAATETVLDPRGERLRAYAFHYANPALAAQEKAVAEQNKSNTLAIDKSEQATKETIAANANQTSTGLAGLGTVMDDLKSRVVRLEGLIQSSRIASEDSLAVNTFGQTAEQNRMVQSRTNIQLSIAAISGLSTELGLVTPMEVAPPYGHSVNG